MDTGPVGSQLEKISVLIADDHAVVREGTRQILQKEPDIEVVAEACDGEEAVRLATTFAPDVAILDIAMPKADGIEATRQIKAVRPSVAVLILSAYDDEQFVFSLLEAGVAGYLLKSVRARDLVEAVRAVHAGESVLHPQVARKVLNQFSGTPTPDDQALCHETLSDREMDVLGLAARGLSNRDIADNLCLSVRTVQAHLGHIFGKMQVASRTEAVIKALKHGWVSLDDVP